MCQVLLFNNFIRMRQHTCSNYLSCAATVLSQTSTFSTGEEHNFSGDFWVNVECGLGIIGRQSARFLRAEIWEFVQRSNVVNFNIRSKIGKPVIGYRAASLSSEALSAESTDIYTLLHRVCFHHAADHSSWIPGGKLAK